MTTTPRPVTGRALAALVAALALAVTALLPQPQASAAPADFPSKAQVKQAMGGAGHWTSFRTEVGSLGARPAGCRSDRQFLDFSSARARVYFGREQGFPASILSGASAYVFRYPTAEAARLAVHRNASYPVRCPKVTEWVCEECDGISTTRRTLVPAALVGQQSVAWRFKEVGNLKSSGHTVVARRGSTVVLVAVTRTRDSLPTGNWTYPAPPAKKVAVRLARAALRAAT